MDNIMNDGYIRNILQKNAEIIRIDVYGKRKIHEIGMSERDLAKKYRIISTPTLIFLDTRGKELLRIPGAVTKDDFKDLLCSYVDGIKNKGCY